MSVEMSAVQRQPSSILLLWEWDFSPHSLQNRKSMVAKFHTKTWENTLLAQTTTQRMVRDVVTLLCAARLFLSKASSSTIQSSQSYPPLFAPIFWTKSTFTLPCLIQYHVRILFQRSNPSVQCCFGRQSKLLLWSTNCLGVGGSMGIWFQLGRLWKRARGH